MKRLCAILFLGILTTGPVLAQDTFTPVTGKAIYFDVSPPLRDRHPGPPGITDRSWKEGAVANTLPAPGISENMPPGTADTIVQTFQGQLFPDTILRNFDGLGNVNNIVPPDTYGDAGPAHYFQLVNLSFAIYGKTGVKLLGPLNTSMIWEGLPHNYNNGDGIVLYDEQADRWLISQFSFPSFPVAPFYLMVAVSQTPDPMGAWYRWEFAFGDLPDYPKFGIWPDGYYLSYGRIKSGTLQQDGVSAVAFDRNAMLAGDPAPANIQFNAPPSECPVNFLPADCDGPFPPAGTPNYYGYIRGGSFVVREFHADWANPAASTFGNILNLPVSPHFPVTRGIPQLESDKELTPLDDRLMYRLQYRDFGDHMAMVVNHTVGVGLHAGIRWYELQKTNGSWFVHQQSTYAPDTLSRWMGSIAMDSAGNIALGYSVSARTMYPSVRFTGRTKHDPPGQMTLHETNIIDGTGSQTGIWAGQSRWGDYSSMTVDPVDPSTFWYTQEYYATTSNNGWKTRIASFSFANILDLHATASPPVVCTGGAVHLDVQVSGGSGARSYAWTSDPAGFSSDQKDPSVTPVIPATYIVTVRDGQQEKTDSVVVPVIPAPLVFPGNDTSICRYVAELPLEGSAFNCISTRWATSGDGYFTDPGALNTVYRPGMNDRLSDSITLTLTANPATPCLPVSAARKVSIEACAGVTELPGSGFTVTLHPNPVRDKLTIDIAGTGDHQLTIRIANVLEEILFRETIETAGLAVTRQVDLSGLSTGIYFVRVEGRSGIAVRAFVVQ